MIASVAAAWLIACLLLSLVSGLLFQLISSLLLYLAGERLAVLTPTLALLLVLNGLIAAAVTYFCACTHSLLLVRLYQAARMSAGEPLAKALPPVERAEHPPAGLKRPRQRWLLAAAAVFFLAMAIVSWQVVEQIGLQDRVAVTAHRGSSLRAPENTPAAISLAIEEGADFVEIDVQETADGRVVVLHDADLMRVAGVQRNIWEVRYEELQQLDVGVRFDPRFQGERIAALTDVIDLCRGRTKLNIELKYNGHAQQLEQRVIDVLRKEEFLDQCVVSSLNLDGVLKIKQLEPRLSVGLISAVSIGRAAELDVDFLSVSRRQAARRFIEDAHLTGKQVHVWTVNDAPAMNRLIDMGVDNLLTDDPRLAKQLLAERAALGTSQRLLLRLRTWLDD